MSQPSDDQKAIDVPKLKSSYPRKQSRGPTSIKVKQTIPKIRQDLKKWTGWGFKDSQFTLEKGIVKFTGNRYELCNKTLPYLEDYIEQKLGVTSATDILLNIPEMPPEKEYPVSKFPEKLLEEIRELGIEVSTAGADRLIRSQGEGLEAVYKIKYMKSERIPDAVAYPTCHEEVVEIVRLANERNFVIIPFGGGTSVAGDLECPHYERRPILSLDMCLMNEILWVDKESLVICVEAGCVGQDLERELNNIGFTTGHDPDSIEFSTVGGWVSTRASGMKKNTYGNIEDLVVHVRMVTSTGVLEKGTRAPRMSAGPDFNHIVLGSEGCFGVITEVVMKIRPFPECAHFGSLIFPDFETGIHYLREVAKRRWQPASIRLLDHEQFQLGLALRPEASLFGSLKDGLKFGYLEYIMKFDPKKICMTTLLYEGYKSEVIDHEKKLNALAKQFGGIPAGAVNGKRGYMMTYLVAYVRDIALNHDVIAESIETAVPWDRAIALVKELRQTISQECMKMGVSKHMALLRIAQTYDAGCCIYVYYVFPTPKNINIIEACSIVHNVLKTVVINRGGSISHHHGVGKYRIRWYEETVSKPGLQLFLSAKKTLDPKNIFGCGNIALENISKL